MHELRRFLTRILTLLRSDRAESELTREVNAHLRLLEEQFVARGMSATDARYAARRAFGGVEQAKEHQRDARTFRWLAGWPMDLKLGARMLVKSPGLTAVAVVALSLAVGAGVMYHQVVREYYHPSFPGPGADRVVAIVNWDTEKRAAADRSLHDFLRIRASVQSLQDLGVFTFADSNLITEDGRSEPVNGIAISASAFRILQTLPLLGRPLTDADEATTAPPVAVIGHHLWSRRFESSPTIIGRTVKLGDTPHTIVGVMPEGFGFPVNHSLWVPFRVADVNVRQGEGPWIRMFGRLAPGVELRTAQAEVAAIGHRLASSQPARPRLVPRLMPYLEARRAGDAESSAELLIIYAVNLVFVGLLAICGANVAALVVARTALREGEITVRTALGASRSRVVAQLFAEALVLVAVATAVGLLLAAAGLRELTAYAASQGVQIPFWWHTSLSPATLLYAAILAVFAAAIIGVIPALHATGRQMQARLKHAAGSAAGMRLGRVWTGVIAAQVALTVIFLLGVVSIGWNVYVMPDVGTTFAFNTSEFLTAKIEKGRGLLAAYREVERRLESDPGVAGVTYATHFPGTNANEFWVDLDPSAGPAATTPDDGPLWVRSVSVAADFFETIGAPIVLGRGLTPADVAANLPVAVVDETFARLIFGGRNPLGQLIRHNAAGQTPDRWLHIVGVVRDLSVDARKTTEDAVVYRPAAVSDSDRLAVLVRVRGDVSGWGGRARTIAASADPTLRLDEVMSLNAVHESERSAQRFLTKALVVISAVALLLSTAGVYALMSFTLARRTREIGIRVALGAAPGRIVSAIFSRAFVQVGLGVLAGSVPGAVLVALGTPEISRGGGLRVALAATGAVAFLLVVIALFACVGPARRALRIQPTEALRADA